MYLEILKDHHEGIYKLLDTITGAKTETQAVNQADDISRALSRLAGLISIHLAAEDKFLYPNLAKSEVPKIRETATTFDQEMGHLADTFTTYKEAFMTPTKIKNNPAGFLQETHRVIGALIERLQREDQELYPLVEE